jgi:glyoxylase-like metal-dependent hydrolase (beta-lactamase superfamily II)
VWLSVPITITVGAPGGAAAPSLALDVPEPDGAVVVALGRQHSGARATLVDPGPGGPLAERYRPAFYVADGAGRLRLPGGRIKAVVVPRLDNGGQ